MIENSKNRTYTRREVLRMAGMSAAVLALSACAAPATPAPEAAPKKPAPSKEKVHLRIQMDPDYEKPVGDLFLKSHPEAEIEYVSVTGIDHEEVASKILSMVAAGQILDLGYAATEATQLYAGQGLAEPLDEWVKRDADELKEYFADVHPSLVEAMMWEGSLYELPFDFNAANLYFNTKLVAEAGFEHPPQDWTKDDFYKLAKAITKKGSGGETEVFGYGWTNRLWGSWMPWIFVNGSNLLVEERAPGGEWLWETFYKDDPAAKGRSGGWRWTAPKANDPANVEALEFMVQLYKEGITPAVEMGGGETLSGFFGTGKLGMIPAGGFWVGHLKNAGMKRGDYDVQLFPKWKTQRHQFGTAGLWIFTKSKNKDLAWEYSKLRVSKEAMAIHGWYNGTTLTTPVRRSMLNEERFAETGPEHWQVFYDTLDKHPDTAPIPAPPVSNPMTTLFTSYTAKAMSLEMTPKEALDAMQKELEDLFARYPDMYKRET
ncbi:MAG: sugar ABC transporter substrate-binding protein [Anaerolineae bacterium]|nr:sugar ABC transporter substrate-binding protein [Anaerolineae bacterium]